MRPVSQTCVAVFVLALAAASAAVARPVANANSFTLLGEYTDGTMTEFQIAYAPKYWWSVGLGRLEITGEGHGSTAHRQVVTYARANLLAKRWNMESAQANIFLWGGAGRAELHRSNAPDDSGDPDEHDHGGGSDSAEASHWMRWENSWNAGGQIDYETRRIYGAFRSDFHHSSLYWHRMDTLQLGFAPYEHDVHRVATWIVASATRYSGDLHEDTEVSLLLRFFKRRAWIEAGSTIDGKLHAKAMFSL